MDQLLRHLTIGFSPGEAENTVDFSRLSDGQKSLLYLTLVLSLQAIGRKVLAKKSDAFDVDKLRPALFTLIAIEEPENSLSPHYLGRIIKALSVFSDNEDAQSIVATHAPSLLKRVSPEKIRYLRLNGDRETTVKSIVLPKESSEAHKFVREAVQAFPELYFSRFVILGEGDSEEIVLPRFLQAKGLGHDETSISIVPLGGRHVSHFWRLLHALEIPQVTLLDLDLGRHGGGWGRIRYGLQQLLKFPTIESTLNEQHVKDLPKWNSDSSPLTLKLGKDCMKFLESAGVFFSSPVDLDFAMLRAFPGAYSIENDELVEPDKDILSSVLGKKHGDVGQYSEEEQKYFDAYHRRFKLGSKPAAHLGALGELEDAEINKHMPGPISRLIDMVKDKLAELPE
jgi:putative ATP-dependent endonuclease of OLD family